MNIRVIVDGKVCYSDRTFKIAEAFDLMQIALTEGQIPPGKVTSVIITQEVIPTQIRSDGVAVTSPSVITEDVIRNHDRDDGVVYEEVVEDETPAVDTFMEGRACAI